MGEKGLVERLQDEGLVASIRYENNGGKRMFNRRQQQAPSGGTKSELHDVCGLYVSKRKDGTEYLRGKMKDGTIFYIFENQHKKEDRHPDYKLLATRDLNGGEEL